MTDLPYRQGTNVYLIDVNNDFLILQKTSYGPDQWEVAGGGLDVGETPIQGALRELKEELSVDVQDLEVLGESSHLYTFEWSEVAIEDAFRKKGIRYRGQQKHQFLIRFTGDKSSIKKQDDEIRLLKWVPESELKEHFIFEGQWENTQKVLEDFKAKGWL